MPDKPSPTRIIYRTSPFDFEMLSRCHEQLLQSRQVLKESEHVTVFLGDRHYDPPPPSDPDTPTA